MPQVYIGIGTNIGNRMQNILEAKKMLFSEYRIKHVMESSIEETEPVDFLEQPEFYNQVLLVETEIAPSELLGLLKNIESEMGRKKSVQKGPRIIDLDILLYDKLMINSEELTIPHPGIRKREFILKHLLEIDPEISDPADNMKYCNIYKNLLKIQQNNF